MKKLRVNFIFLFLLGIIVSITSVQKAEAQVSVSFQFFYDQLSPYGSWISDPQYGYVWIPTAGPGFRPYLSNGHWVLTEDGWMWASYYDWGWAPFHYGSWMMDPAFGWVWVPGYDWAPAWVTWGDYNGYYGWAPVQPGFGFSFSTYHPPIDYWCFMHPRFMTAAVYTDHFFVAHNRRIELGSNTTVINNVTNINVVNNVTRRNNASFNAGPRRVDFENSAKVKVQPVAIREASAPGKLREEKNTVSIYRPSVAKESLATEKPKRVVPADEVKQKGSVVNENGIRNNNSAPSENKSSTPIEEKNRVHKETVPSKSLPTQEPRSGLQSQSPNQIQSKPEKSITPQPVQRPQNINTPAHQETQSPRENNQQTAPQPRQEKRMEQRPSTPVQPRPQPQPTQHVRPRAVPQGQRIEHPHSDQQQMQNREPQLQERKQPK